MKTKALILGLIALASVAEISSAQGKGGGANTSKPDSVTGIIIAVLDPGGSAIPRITWNAIDKATYQVQRSKVGDSCCTNASPVGLTTNAWQDSPPPSSGTYVYRVIATVRTGQLVGQAQMSYTAPAATGRYRLSVSAVRVVTPTIPDDPTMVDGVGDEIYVAGIVLRVDRNTAAKLGATVVKSKEYGDIGNNGSTYPNRIRAGTASPYGGLNGGSSVGDPGTPGAETFPFVLWEGSLTDGGEAVVVLPSVWERDTSDFVWRDYSGSWTTNTAPLLGSQLLRNQYSSTTLTPVVAPLETGAVQQGVTGAMYGAYYIGLDWLSGADRMIGMVTSGGTNPVYQERIVVLTREKLAGMVVGGTTDLQIPLNENIQGGGLYTLILRVQRIG
jgi:hypothetical protein